jgi:hypothetical protein
MDMVLKNVAHHDEIVLCNLRLEPKCLFDDVGIGTFVY